MMGLMCLSSGWRDWGSLGVKQQGQVWLKDLLWLNAKVAALPPKVTFQVCQEGILQCGVTACARSPWLIVRLWSDGSDRDGVALELQSSVHGDSTQRVSTGRC